MRIITIMFILLFSCEVYSQTRVLGPLEPNNTSDSYPTHSDIYGKGGLVTTTNAYTRNQITTLRRSAGMWVQNATCDSVWRLGAGLTNSDWNLVSFGVGGISPSDTAAMLANYVIFGDTANMLSNYVVDGQLNLKVNISDTATMLSHYIDRADTASMLSPYVLESDTAAMLNHYIDRADTAGMLSNYVVDGQLNLKVNISDTSSMLSKYLLKTDTATMLGNYVVDGQLNLKVNISDTASMLAPYIDRADTATMLSHYIDRADTAAMLTNYVTDGDIAGKVNVSDTATMLSHYIDRADTASMLANYVVDGQLNLKLTNPLTTTGDMIYSSSGSTATRLPIGASNTILKIISGAPTWQSDRSDTAFDGNRQVTLAGASPFTNTNFGGSTVTAFLGNVFFPSQVPTTSLTGGTTLEKRSAGSTNVLFRWTACRQASTQPISTINVASNSKTGFAQPSAGGCVIWTGGNPWGDTTIAITNNTNTTYGVTVTTTDSKTASTSQTVSWSWKRYWGICVDSIPTQSEILNAVNGGNELSEAAAKNNFTISTSTSTRMFYAYVSSAGTLNSIVIGGFPSLLTFYTNTVSITNALGGNTTYRYYALKQPTAASITIQSAN